MEFAQYYDIVITDIIMPFLDGKELIKEINTINEKQVIAVISADLYPTTSSTFINLGIDDFLQKPITKENLQKSLYQLSKKAYSQKKF